MRTITEFTLPASTNGAILEKPSGIGEHFAIPFISVLLFLGTLWIGITFGAPANKPSLPTSDQQSIAPIIPTIATTQPRDNPQQTVNVAQTNIVETNIHLNVNVISAPGPSVVYVHNTIVRPSCPAIVHVPYFVPSAPRTIFVPRPRVIMYPAPMIRHY